MGAPRKQPGSNIPVAVQERCSALISLLEKARLTNKQVIAAGGLTISEQTFSRHLLGQRSHGPAPEVITAIVTVAARALDTTTAALLDAYPPLRGSTNPAEDMSVESLTLLPDSMPRLIAETEASQARRDTAEALMNLVFDGHEYYAAAALDQLVGSYTCDVDVLELIADHVPLAAAALLSAVSQILGHERCDTLLTALATRNPSTAKRVQEFFDDEVQSVWRPLTLDYHPCHLHAAGLLASIRRGRLSAARREFLTLATPTDEQGPPLHTEVFASLARQYPDGLSAAGRLLDELLAYKMGIGPVIDILADLDGSSSDSAMLPPVLSELHERSLHALIAHCADPSRRPSGSALLDVVLAAAAPERLAGALLCEASRRLIVRVDEFLSEIPELGLVLRRMGSMSSRETALFLARAFDEAESATNNRAHMSTLSTRVATMLEYDDPGPQVLDVVVQLTQMRPRCVELLLSAVQKGTHHAVRTRLQAARLHTEQSSFDGSATTSIIAAEHSAAPLDRVPSADRTSTSRASELWRNGFRRIVRPRDIR